MHPAGPAAEVILRAQKMNVKAHITVLEVLAEEGDNWYYYQQIADKTGLEFMVVRRTVRHLVRKKLVEHSTLFGCDGLVMGSGHKATSRGRAVSRLISARDRPVV